MAAVQNNLSIPYLPEVKNGSRAANIRRQLGMDLDAASGSLRIYRSDDGKSRLTAANNKGLVINQADSINDPIACEIISASTRAALFVDQNADGNAINIDAEITASNGINCAVDVLTTGCGFCVSSSATAITGAGRLLYVNHTGATSTSGTLAEVKSDSTDETDLLLATGAGTGYELTLTNTNAGGVGAELRLNHTSASAADDDVTGRIIFTADDEETSPTNTTIGQIDCLWTDATAASYASRFIIYTSTGAAQNEAMRILDTGQIQVDLASEINTGTGAGDVFDEYDDAKLLQQWSIDSQAAVDKLCEIGVVERKDSGSGYLLNLQQMVWLLAGGIYQTRDRLDAAIQRISALESVAA